ncbi:hypothetical protein AAW28_07910 [Lacticaseibacillus casei]|nr:hypothetical protein AAW28_07910 [Lacticaseibacillus casei]
MKNKSFVTILVTFITTFIGIGVIVYVFENLNIKPLVRLVLYPVSAVVFSYMGFHFHKLLKLK